MFAYAYVFVLTTLAYCLNGSWSGPGTRDRDMPLLGLVGLEFSQLVFSAFVVVVVVAGSRIITLTRLLRPLYELLKKCWAHVAVQGLSLCLPVLFYSLTVSASSVPLRLPLPFLCCRSFYLFL